MKIFPLFNSLKKMIMIQKPCNKVKFINEQFAEEYISKLQKTSKRKLKPVRAYLCEKCLTWHLSSIENMSTIITKLEQERRLVKEQKQQEYEKRSFEMQLEKKDAKIKEINDKYSVICNKHKALKEEYLLFKISVSILIM